MLEEDRLTVALDEPELREDRLTLERDEFELRDGVDILLLEDDRVLTELLEGAREADLWTELDEDGRRIVVLEDRELREGAVVTRPLEDADKEEVEENLRMEFLAALLFSVEVEDLFAVLVLDGAWELEEEKRFTTLFVVEDLNIEGIIPFPCTAEFPDVPVFCELGEYLLMARGVIPGFETLSELLARLEGLLITLEFLMPELDVRMDVDFTRERELIVFSEG